MNRTMKVMMCGVAAMTLAAAAVETLADPVVRPNPPKHSEQGERTTGTQRPSQWNPGGKSRFWIPIFGNMPGSDLPWMRHWVTDPHEEDAPDEPGDIGGGDLPPG